MTTEMKTRSVIDELKRLAGDHWRVDHPQFCTRYTVGPAQNPSPYGGSFGGDCITHSADGLRAYSPAAQALLDDAWRAVQKPRLEGEEFVFQDWNEPGYITEEVGTAKVPLEVINDLEERLSKSKGTGWLLGARESKEVLAVASQLELVTWGYPTHHASWEGFLDARLSAKGSRLLAAYRRMQ